MAYDHLPPSKSARPRKRSEPVFCAGWRAFVHWPAKANATSGPVPLNDASGKAPVCDLADGQPVEILAWRPTSREGLMYQIQRVADGSQWWVAAKHLRRNPVAEATAVEQ
jgi:hypothetical protein